MSEETFSKEDIKKYEKQQVKLAKSRADALRIAMGYKTEEERQREEVEEVAQQLTFTLFKRQVALYYSDFFTLIGAVIFFVLGFFYPLYYLSFVFSAALVATIIIRSPFAKLTAIAVIVASYIIIWFTSSYINPLEILSLVLLVNSISKWIYLVGAIAAIVVYFLGIITGIYGYKENNLGKVAIIILGLSIGSALVDLFGNIYVFGVVNPLALTIDFVLNFTAYLCGLLITFVVVFAGVYGIVALIGKMIQMEVE